ncbi:MAG: hypothetical protein HYR62_08900 [Actinobacteria bacterium]|nr:hypothetical protein [Actinomycetota bacterium]MBI3688560.1 hypothetical protein [Actinomycetota bacterium]
MWWLTCPVCDLTSGPMFHADEAETLAGVHDALHHRGTETAVVVKQSRVAA